MSTETQADPVEHLTDEQMNALAFRVVELLDGVPVGQAMSILERWAPLILKDGHVVDVTNRRFKALKAVPSVL